MVGLSVSPGTCSFIVSLDRFSVGILSSLVSIIWSLGPLDYQVLSGGSDGTESACNAGGPGLTPG